MKNFIIGFLLLIYLFLQQSFALPFGIVGASPLRIVSNVNQLLGNNDNPSSFLVTNTSGKTAYVEIIASIGEKSGMPDFKTIPSSKIGNPEKFGIIVTPVKLVVPNGQSREIKILPVLSDKIIQSLSTDKVYYITVKSVQSFEKKNIEMDKKSGVEAGLSLIPEYIVQYIITPKKTLSNKKNYNHLTFKYNKTQDLIKILNSGISFNYIEYQLNCPGNINVNNLIMKRKKNPYSFIMNENLCKNLGGKTLFSENNWSTPIPSKDRKLVFFLEKNNLPIVCDSKNSICKLAK